MRGCYESLGVTIVTLKRSKTCLTAAQAAPTPLPYPHLAHLMVQGKSLMEKGGVVVGLSQLLELLGHLRGGAEELSGECMVVGEEEDLKTRIENQRPDRDPCMSNKAGPSPLCQKLAFCATLCASR